MMNKRQKAHRKGIWAERLAALYLMLKGYKILEMRYKTPVGEIDILAQKKNALVAVEVKMRVALVDALEAVVPKSQLRIEKTIGYFLALNPEYSVCDVRFDVIAVQMRLPFLMRHLDNAWQART